MMSNGRWSTGNHVKQRFLERASEAVEEPPRVELGPCQCHAPFRVTQLTNNSTIRIDHRSVVGNKAGVARLERLHDPLNLPRVPDVVLITERDIVRHAEGRRLEEVVSKVQPLWILLHNHRKWCSSRKLLDLIPGCIEVLIVGYHESGWSHCLSSQAVQLSG